MSELDIAVVVILVISAIIAVMRGFVTEVLSLAAWGGAAIITVALFKPLGDWVESFIEVEWLSRGMAIAFLFFFSLMLLRLITNKIGGWVRSSQIGILDRGIGAAFGVLRGFVLMAFAFLMYTVLIQPEDPPEWVAEAKTGPAIMDGAQILAKVIYGGEGGESPTDVLKRLKGRAEDIAREKSLESIGYKSKDRDSLEDLAKSAN